MNANVDATPGTAGETAVRGVAYRRLHLPTSVAFTGDERLRAYEGQLAALLLRAVRAAIEQDDQLEGAPGSPWRSPADAAQPATEPPTAVQGRPAEARAEAAATAAHPTAEPGPPAETTPSGRSTLTFAVAVPDIEGEGSEGSVGPETGADDAQSEGRKGAAQPPPPASAPPASAERPSGATPTATTSTATTSTATTSTATTSTSTTSTTTAPQSARPTPQAEPDEESGTPGDVPEQDIAVTVVSEERSLSEVVQGPSPVDGRAVMVVGATQLVMLGEATRHARSRSLVHAVQLGDHLFGARSFAVLEGPLGTPESFYWAVATSPTVTDETIGSAVGKAQLEGQEISLFKGITVLPFVTTLDGHRYGVNLLWTKERGWLYGSKEEGRRWLRLTASPTEQWLSAEQLRVHTFQELDRSVEAGLAGDDASAVTAAAQLSDMDAKTFALVDTKTRAKYLEILIKAWTFEEQRHAIIQIMLSLEGLDQLQAVRDRLIQAGLYEQLFADMGSDLWELLTMVGKRFGDHKPLTQREFLTLVEEAFNLSMRHDAGLARTVEGEETAVIGLKRMIEFEEAARAATGFVLSTLEAIKMMLTQPEKVLSGLFQLVRLLVICHLAGWGHQPSMKELQALLHHIGAALVDGLRGAALLGVGPRAVTRIKWAVIIEALTWISEIKAVVEALVKIEKLVAVLRFLKMLRVVEGEQIAARFTRLAEALHAGSAALKGLKDEHALTELLLMLPEEDGARLGAVLRDVDVPKGSTLASLLEHPRLGPVTADLERKAAVLHRLGVKSGGLTPELAHAFGRLAGKDGFEMAEVARMVEAIPEGEGTRFTTMLDRIGFGRIGAKAEVKADLLATLAGESRRMEAVHRYGIDIVREMHGRAAGGAEALDAMLARLQKIREKDLAGGRAVEFGEFLDDLKQGKKGAWRRVDPPPRAPRAKATAAERAPVLERIEELRKRFPKGKVKNPKLMAEGLGQIRRISETDPARAMEHLERFEELLKAESTLEGHVAEIVSEAEAKAGREAKALHHEPDEAPPERLGVRDKLRSKTGRAQRASRDLAENMEAIGQYQPYGHEAHHIVAYSDRRAEPARQILEWAGINPRDNPLNGVYLPRTSMDPKIVSEAATRHQTLHTDNYYKEVTRRLVEARKQAGREGVIHEMSRIKEELINNSGWKDPGPATGAAKQSFAQWFAEYRHHLEWLTEAEQLETLKKVTPPPRKRKAAPKAGPKPAPKPKPAQKPKPAAKAAPKQKAEPTVKAKAEPRTTPEAEAKPMPEPKVEPQPSVRVEPRPRPTPDVEPPPKPPKPAEPKSKAWKKFKPKAAPRPKPKPTSEVKPTSKPKTKTKPQQRKPEPEVRRRVATGGGPSGEPAEAVPAAPTAPADAPAPHVRVEPDAPRVRVGVGEAPEKASAEALGEALDDVAEAPSKPEGKQMRVRKEAREE